MARFTSTRERRLWGWAMAVLAAIYAAGLLAGSLVEMLGAETLLGFSFVTGFGLAILAVVGMALSRRSRSEVWVALGVATAYLMIPVRLGAPTLERTHLFEYGLLAVLLYEAMSERKDNGRAVRLPGLMAIFAATTLGWLDEAIQGLIPGRVYDVEDVLVNGLAAVVAVAAAAMLRWMRARNTRRHAPLSTAIRADVDDSLH